MRGENESFLPFRAFKIKKRRKYRIWKKKVNFSFFTGQKKNLLVQYYYKIFRKGKSPALKFKNSGDLPNQPLAKAENKNIRQKIAVKKVLLGKAEHYYTKSKIAQFLIENGEVSLGDKILISGPTTGEQEITLTQIFANGNLCERAKSGDQITFPTPFRVRLSDKLYKVLA